MNPVLDQTGSTGIWSFDFRYSLGLTLPLGPAGERLTISEAVEKHLGLKLEERQVPTQVLIVKSVNQTPGENPPGTPDAVPPMVAPMEFEVASVKASSPDSRGGRFQMQPGGRLTSENLPLRFLITRAFNTTSNDQLTLPSWVDTARFDVIAKTHRTSRLNLSLILKRWCQNITMTQFADLLGGRTPDLQMPVLDSTGIEGSWDFTPTFNPVIGLQVAAVRPPDAGQGNPAPAASEPTAGYSIYEALEKQPGLKLEKQKRAAQVIVIDHIEQTPTPD